MARPIRILFIEANEDGTTGGSHRSLFELVRRLDRTCFEPIVLYYQKNPYVDRLTREGITVLLYDDVRQQERQVRTSGHFLSKVIDIGAAVRRRRAFLQHHEIDLVHINNSPRIGCDDWLPACRLLSIPIVSSVRGDASGPTTVWQRLFFRRFDRVMPVSKWLGQAMIEAGIPEDRVKIVYNGIDTGGIVQRLQRDPQEIRSELGVRSEDLFAVMVGNIRHWKGQHVVVEAAGIARDKGASLKIALAGETGTGDESLAYERQLRAQVDRKGLRETILFLGARSDVPDLFRAADVAIHSSVAPEPFGLVIVEAMATGTAVIASKEGGPAEIVTEDSGFLHDPDDPNDLAQTLLSLSRDRRSLVHMSQKATERAAGFDIARTIEDMQSVYSDLMK